jgi:hypothetical protein
MPYIIRVWAIRDIVLAIVVAIADRQTVMTLLLPYIAIDTTDVVSAHLSRVAGLFNVSETRSLQLLAISALIPEIIALALLVFQKTFEQIKVSKTRLKV